MFSKNILQILKKNEIFLPRLDFDFNSISFLIIF